MHCFYSKYLSLNFPDRLIISFQNGLIPQTCYNISIWVILIKLILLTLI